MRKWFTYGWWAYLLAPRYERYKGRAESWPKVVLCRARGHAGIVFFNAGGLEPDFSCRRCGEEIG